MKRNRWIVMISICVILSVGLFGCGKKKESNNYFEGISNVQEIRITDKDGVQIRVIEDDQKLKDLIEQLQTDTWTLSSGIGDATKAINIEFKKRETVKLGQSQKDADLYTTCTMHAYKDQPYVVLEIKGISVTFKTTDKTQEYLNSFAK